MAKVPENTGEGGEAQNEAPGLAILSQEVKELVRLISATDISELHLESGSVRITIKRGGSQPVAGHSPAPVYTPPATLPASESSSLTGLIGSGRAPGSGVELKDGEQLLVAPMVGTFYAAPHPGSPPFVAEEDFVEAGQTIGIIEAMKMMNEIASDFSGRVARVLVQNAQPVEYGQPLMVITVE